MWSWPHLTWQPWSKCALNWISLFFSWTSFWLNSGLPQDGEGRRQREARVFPAQQCLRVAHGPRAALMYLLRVLDFPLSPSMILSNKQYAFLNGASSAVLSSVTCKGCHLVYNKVEQTPLKWCSTIHVQFKQNNPTLKRKQCPRQLSMNFLTTNFFFLWKNIISPKKRSPYIEECSVGLSAPCASKSQAILAHLIVLIPEIQRD